MTTLGVIGLGRIGAFHTDTLSGLDSVDGLGDHRRAAGARRRSRRQTRCHTG